jgi:hypothetical protein
MAPKKGAKPEITTSTGYRLNGREIKQVKIATSNLFIDTGTVPVDDMTGAIFDDIGGNEFINGGSSGIILQEGNSLISNANEILYYTNTKTNEKQADGTDSIFSQFEISLNSYLPSTISSTPEFLGYYFGNPADPELTKTFLEKNVYFDDTYSNIYIELNNLPIDEEVEIEFITSSTNESGII